MSESADFLHKIFDEAVAIKESKSREKFLDGKCGNDSELRKRLQRLLDCFEESVSFLDPNIQLSDSQFKTPKLTKENAKTEIPTNFSCRSDAQFPSYRPIEMIGDGGHGVVFRAEQEKPIRRTVAIKLLKNVNPSPELRARFSIESKALAELNHSTIAKVFDVGTTDEGVPFFAMEFVNGKTITAIADEQKLSLRSRVELFVDVCKGIEHAHQSGFIHRDIKPQNVLVTLENNKLLPKIIDFGIAKSLAPKSQHEDVKTHNWQWLGTPYYMSPEAANPNSRNMDVRCDVFSLGVLLFELLCGSTPLNKTTIGKLEFDELIDRLRNFKPIAPSHRIQEIHSQRPEECFDIAASRGTTIESLFQQINKDIDCIILKATANDREIRYDSVAAFRKDVERFLSNDPIEARPPSLMYVAEKLYKKHQVIANTCIGFIILLMATTGFSIWLALNSAYHKNIAQKALLAERTAKDQAKAALEKSETDNMALRKLADIFSSVLESPMRQVQGRDVLVVELLGSLEDAILELEETPKIQAEFFTTFGTCYLNLGEIKSARRCLKRAIQWFENNSQLGNKKARVALLDNAQVLLTMNELSKARESLDKLLAIQAGNKPDLNERIRTLQLQGDTHRGMSRFKEARSSYLDAMELSRQASSEKSAQSLYIRSQLVAVALDFGLFEDAIELSDDIYQTYRELNNPKLMDGELQAARSYAENLGLLNRVAEATEIVSARTDDALKTYGPLHPNYADFLLASTSFQISAGKMADAERNLDYIFENSDKFFDDVKIEKDALTLRAAFYSANERYDHAIADIEKVQDRIVTDFGKDHQHYFSNSQALATYHAQAGELTKAMAMMKDLLVEAETAKNLTDFGRYRCARSMAEFCNKAIRIEPDRKLAQKLQEMVVQYYELAARYAESSHGTDSAQYIIVKGSAAIGNANMRNKDCRFEDVENMVVFYRDKRFGHTHEKTITEIRSLIMIYDMYSEFSNAERWLNELIEIYQNKFGPKSKQVRNCEFNKIYLLEKQNKIEEALQVAVNLDLKPTDNGMDAIRAEGTLCRLNLLQDNRDETIKHYKRFLPLMVNFGKDKPATETKRLLYSTLLGDLMVVNDTSRKRLSDCCERLSRYCKEKPDCWQIQDLCLLTNFCRLGFIRKKLLNDFDEQYSSFQSQIDELYDQFETMKRLIQDSETTCENFVLERNSNTLANWFKLLKDNKTAQRIRKSNHNTSNSSDNAPLPE